MKSGEGIDVQCKTTGVPVPDVMWYHNGQVIENRLYNNSCLFIAKVVVSDAGLYNVVAENTEGVVQTNFTVHVASSQGN